MATDQQLDETIARLFPGYTADQRSDVWSRCVENSRDSDHAVDTGWDRIDWQVAIDTAEMFADCFKDFDLPDPRAAHRD